MSGYFMGMQRDLRMRKFLQAIILSAEFISISTYNKFTKSVRYIHKNKSWERCYVLLKIIFPCLGVLCLADINIFRNGQSLLLFENDQAVHLENNI